MIVELLLELFWLLKRVWHKCGVLNVFAFFPVKIKRREHQNGTQNFHFSEFLVNFYCSRSLLELATAVRPTVGCASTWLSGVPGRWRFRSHSHDFKKCGRLRAEIF